MLINVLSEPWSLVYARLASAIMTIIRSFKTQPRDFAVRDPFEVLVATILSQNTNVKNARIALHNLRSEGRLSAGRLARTPLSKIETMVKPSGLYRSKAKSIKGVAQHILERYRGRMATMLAKDPIALREELTSLPGIGPKTADIVLAFCVGFPTIPVDTHIARISARLGLVEAGSSYETVKKKLERVIAEKDRLVGHLALIGFGRAICLARRPRCSVCPVQKDCRYYQEVFAG